MGIIDQIFKELGSDLVDGIVEIGTSKSLNKAEFFLKEGQINNHLAIVLKGFLQSFFNKDGDEITTYLAGPGKLVVSLSSYLSRQPSKECIRALTYTE